MEGVAIIYIVGENCSSNINCFTVDICKTDVPKNYTSTSSSRMFFRKLLKRFLKSSFASDF